MFWPHQWNRFVRSHTAVISRAFSIPVLNIPTHMCFWLLFLTSSVQAQAVSVQELIERGADESVETLIDRVINGGTGSKWASVALLGDRRAEGAPGLPAIVEVAKDKKEQYLVRVSAIRAIAKIILEPNPEMPAMKNATSSLISVVPTLTEFSALSDSDGRTTAVSALIRVANFMKAMKAIDAIPALKAASQALEKSKYPDVRVNATVIQDVVLYLNLLWVRQLLPRFFNNYPYVLILVLAYVILFFVSLLLFWIYPRGLIQINERISDSIEFSLPSWAGGIKLPLRYLLVVGFFHFRARVLNAWTSNYIETSQRVFGSKSIVVDREIFVPTTVDFNGDILAALEPVDLQPVFSRNQALLFIEGEGGVGKTSFACVLAKSAMKYGKESRLCKDHPMLPVLLDQDLDTIPASKDDPLFRFIKNQLKTLIDVPEPPSDRLVRQLLKRGRILVIIDGLSEMTETSRLIIKTGIVDLPINAAVITSRSKEAALDDFSLSVVKPLKVHGNNVSMFFGAYLTKRRKRTLFNDSEFFSMCDQFKSMVKETGGTPLFAKLYAEQVIALKDRTHDDELPMTIPDLLLCYLNHLNRGANIEDRIVQSVAKRLAWECIKKTYRPISASRSSFIQALGDEAKTTAVLTHLEKNLKIIRTTGFGRDSLRFTLDPLSEYLAGLYLIEEYGPNRALWNTFFDQTDSKEGTPDSIKYFLIALRDCCLATRDQFDIPGFVIDELTKRIDSNPNQVIARAAAIGSAEMKSSGT